MTTQRVAAGVPTGGQYAARPRGESAVMLDAYPGIDPEIVDAIRRDAYTEGYRDGVNANQRFDEQIMVACWRCEGTGQRDSNAKCFTCMGNGETPATGVSPGYAAFVAARDELRRFRQAVNPDGAGRTTVSPRTHDA